MLEIIIAYLTIAVVVYAVTKEKNAAIKWPFFLIRFVIDLVSSTRNKREED